jgi:hypothetical protein
LRISQFCGKIFPALLIKSWSPEHRTPFQRAVSQEKGTFRLVIQLQAYSAVIESIFAQVINKRLRNSRYGKKEKKTGS